MHLRSLFTAPLLALGLAALLVAGAANALSISYYLDQTNTQDTDPNGSTYDPVPNLPDGNNYLMVTLADGVDAGNPGDVDVTVTLLRPPIPDPDPNLDFGIHTFFFNSTAELSQSNITLPGGWSASTDYIPLLINADGFGRFNVRLSANTGADRQAETLSFSITGIDDDGIGDYALLATPGSEGDAYFASQVAGFLDQNPLDWPEGDPPDGEGLCTVDGDGNYSSQCNILNSAFFGGTTIVPEPSTALLLLGGLSGLAVAGRRRLH